MNGGKICQEIVTIIGIITVISMVLIVIPSTVLAQDNTEFGTTHGNVVFLKKVTVEKQDSYGNALDSVLEAYFIYGNANEGNHIAYIFKEYMSPSTDDTSWQIKKGTSTDPTTIIVLSSPFSGEESTFEIGTIVPSTIYKSEEAGTVTYTFGIASTMSEYGEGTSVSMTATSYVSWSIPVYYYKYSWRQHTQNIASWYGEVTGDLEFGRSFTGGVGMVYQEAGQQSIHYNFEGKFHHTGFWPWDNYDSTIEIENNFILYLGGGGGTPI